MKSFKCLLKMMAVLSFFTFPFSSTFAQYQTTIPGTGPTGGSFNHCADGIKDNGETGVDCGGSCEPCPTGQSTIVPNFIINFLNILKPKPTIIWRPIQTIQLLCDPTVDDTSSDSGHSMPTAPCTVDSATGMVTVTYDNGVSQQKSIVCDSDGKIISPQCDMNVLSWHTTTCDRGLVCSQGRCVPENGMGTCSQGYTNSDTSSGGSSAPGMTLTVTTSDGRTETFGGNDYCDYYNGSDIVMKVTCDANEKHISYEAVQCADGTTCINGSCQQPLQPTCNVNNDGTISYTNEWGQSSIADPTFCHNDTTLAVQSCDENSGDMVISHQTCSSGKICRNGACRLPPCPKI